MRLFPRFMGERFIRWWLVPCPVQPTVPVWINPRRFYRAVENDPAPLVIGRSVKDVALAIFADFLAIPPRPELGAKGLPFPPRENPLDCITDAHCASPIRLCRHARIAQRRPVRHRVSG